ncbi:MAG: hypothetical protein JWO68_2128, partial [Actinomycetia bacterium]|nr:hypothetical protein [Actinomycetes bacterium]
VHATFDAAATDDGAAEAVRAGRLTKELDPPSSFALLGNLALAAPPAADEPPAPAIDEEALADARARLEAARAEATAAEARREALAGQLDEATDALNAAKRSIEEAVAEVTRLSDP